MFTAIDHNWSQSSVFELYAVCTFCKQQTIVSRGREYEPGDVVACDNPECDNVIKLGKEPDRAVNYGKKDPGTKVSRFFRRVKVAVYRKYFARYE